MQSTNKAKWQVAGAMVFMISVLLLTIGCGGVNSPTSSNSAEDGQPMWNPAPGTQVVPGRDVPRLAGNYWENLGGPAVNPFTSRSSQVIGPEGGAVRMGPHTLIVPPGALDAGTEINFQIAVASMTVIAVDCGPSGMQFKVPLTLVLSLAGTDYVAVNAPPIPDLKIFYMSPEGRFDEEPSTVDRQNKTVSAQISHFSRYIIG